MLYEVSVTLMVEDASEMEAMLQAFSRIKDGEYDKISAMEIECSDYDEEEVEEV